MRWIIAVLVAVTAGYMLFDGVHALTTGNYITPTEGEYAGQLGPWAGLVKSFGGSPHSPVVKMGFVSYGLSALAALSGYLSHQPWGRSALIIMAAFGLWYLPFGTAANILVLILLFLGRG